VEAAGLPDDEEAVLAVDENKLNDFLGQFTQDLGATVHAGMVVLGHRLGLYQAMAGAGPLSPAELAERTGTAERYRVSGWPPRPPPATWPTTRPAGASASLRSRPSRWPTRPARCTCPARSSSPWPASGASRASPRPSAPAPGSAGTSRTPRSSTAARCSSPFVGSDYHQRSIDRARKAASDAGVSDRVRFEVAAADAFAGDGYDLVATFDCFHDMGDPAGAAGHIRRALADDGTWLLVEPTAGDRQEDDLNPVGRLYYGFSVLLCVPNALSQQPRAVLGNQAGEARTRELTAAGGFTRFRRAAETPFNLVYEVRP
jgi:hypothetical protein